MELYIAMQEGKQGGWVPARDSGGKDIIGYLSADEAWKALLENARAGGQFRPSKVERVVVREEPAPPAVEESFRV